MAHQPEYMAISKPAISGDHNCRSCMDSQTRTGHTVYIYEDPNKSDGWY